MKTLELTDFHSDRKEYVVIEKITHWQYFEYQVTEERWEDDPNMFFGLLKGGKTLYYDNKELKTGSMVALQGGVRTIVKESPAEIAKLLSPRKLNMKKGAKNG